MLSMRTITQGLSIGTQITGTGKEKEKFGDCILLASGTASVLLLVLGSSPALAFLGASAFLIGFPTGTYFQYEGHQEAKDIMHENLYRENRKKGCDSCSTPDCDACSTPEMKPEPNIFSRCSR